MKAKLVNFRLPPADQFSLAVDTLLTATKDIDISEAAVVAKLVLS
jgi:hypothetical protein